LNTYNEIMLFECICLFQLVVIKVDTVEACLASLQYAGTTLEGLKKERLGCVDEMIQPAE